MGNSELWYVKLPNGNVHRVTLDQLDEAYQRGQVDLRTQVMGSSTERWMTLAEILSDEEPELPAPPAAYRIGQQYVPPTPYSLRPMSVDFEDVDVDFAPPKRGRAARWAFATLAIAATVAGVGVYRPDLRASAVARVVQVEGRIRSMAAARGLAVAAASPAPPAVAAPPPAVVAPAIAPVVAPAAAPAPTTSPAAIAPGTVAAAPAANPPSSAPATAAVAAAVAGSNVAQANQPTLQPAHTKVTRKAGAAWRAQAQTHTAGAKHGSSVFTTGGSKFDPLNSSI